MDHYKREVNSKKKKVCKHTHTQKQLKGVFWEALLNYKN